MTLVQLGGVGIITVTTFAMVQLGNRATLRQRSVIAESLGTGDRADLRKILRRVLYATFVCEGIGAADLDRAIRVRHAVRLRPFGLACSMRCSAFCNAGFGLLDDNLIPYQGDAVVNLVVPALIVIGGIGFPVLLDLRRHRRRPWREMWERLNLHSKVMLLGTAALITLGFASIMVLEWEGVLAPMPWWKRPMVALFQSVTTRTAGFNTVDLRELTNATLFVMILLMAIGAGPCSTAGGFKVSTLAGPAAVFLDALSRRQPRQRVPPHGAHGNRRPCAHHCVNLRRRDRAHAHGAAGRRASRRTASAPRPATFSTRCSRSFRPLAPSG